MSDYDTAWGALGNAIGAAQGLAHGSISEVDHLTADQQIEVAKVAALLSISQELSKIAHGEGKFGGMIGAKLDAISEGISQAM